MTSCCLNDLQKLFSRLLFRCARFSSDEKKFARREKTHKQGQALFSLFSSLSSFLRESQKNFYFPPQREKRYKNTEHKSAVKEMPFSSSSSSSSSRKALFRLFALSSVVLSHSSSRGRAAGADGVFLRTTTRRDFYRSSRRRVR